MEVAHLWNLYFAPVSSCYNATMLTSALIGLLAVIPSSTNFMLKKYDVGNGVGASTSANYRLLPAITSSQSQLTSANYNLPSGIIKSNTIARPPVPTLTNPDTSYNRLHLTLATASAATDTKYLIGISDDGFATTQYIKADQTVGTTAVIGDYKTYAAWGGASGFWILGLQPNTTYAVRVAALQGAFTGSGFGASTSGVATVSPMLTMSLGIGASTTPPFIIAFTDISASSVTTSPSPVRVAVTTNAQNGGDITISDVYSGMHNFVVMSEFLSKPQSDALHNTVAAQLRQQIADSPDGNIT